MRELAGQLVAGLALGSIYGSVALSLVMVYRSMRIINFAQGEMATFTTYLAWSMLNAGWPYWLAFAATLGVAFVGAIALERIVIRPVESAPLLTVVIVTFGLSIALNGLSGLIYKYLAKVFPSPFAPEPIRLWGVRFNLQDLGIIVVSLLTMLVIVAIFRYTKVGLGMRASSLDPEVSRLLGLRVSWMLAIGWGLAAVVGAISGLMVAPVVFLEPNMMQSALLFAFAAAVLGGISSPVGALIGGAIVGVLLTLAGAYLGQGGAELKEVIALVVIVLVLMVRPSGLFQKAGVVRRV